MVGTRDECSRDTVSKQLDFEEKPKQQLKLLEANGTSNLQNGKSVVLPEQNGDGGDLSFDDDEITIEALKKVKEEFKERLKFLRINDQVRELQTTLRDR